MKRLIILLVLTAISFSGFSQKRNNIKLGGFGYDNWTSLENFSEVGFGAARFTYIFGYERLIGEKLAVSLTYNKILYLDDTPIFEYYTQYSPATISGYRFRDGSYSAQGYFIGYESKYHFEEFDEDGANSFYLGFNYQHGRITEELNNVRYESTSSSSYTSKEVTFNPNNFSINRLGLKLGVTYTGMFTSDFSFAVFLNSQPEINKQWLSPASVNGVSYNLSWVLGVPF
jgi:hypothetical protein